MRGLEEGQGASTSLGAALREPGAHALSLALVLVFLGCPHRVLAMTSCKPEEYPVGDNCCPKCRPGYRVKEACRGSRPTLCVSCTGGTFTAHLNGLDECLQCRACDPDMGLVIRQKCSSTANTVCGCARGRFCVSHDADQCVECRPHSVCRPGQRVRAAGTEHQDVVCEDCPPGTFSPNGTLAECQPWTHSVPLSVALASTVFHPDTSCLHSLSPPSLSLSPVECLCAPGCPAPSSHTPTPSPHRRGRWRVRRTRATPSPAPRGTTFASVSRLGQSAPASRRASGLGGAVPAAPRPGRSPPLGAARCSRGKRSLGPIAWMPRAPPGHLGSSCCSSFPSLQLCLCS